MKRFAWILVLLMASAPIWAANKRITVQQLKDLLSSMQESRKTDEEVAEKLKQVELSEELTRDAMNTLGSLVPGPLTGEQIEIQQGLSAFLAPPSSDLPAAPAPDAAAQKAILSKALDFAINTYMQNPHLAATKSTIRFEDDLVQPSSAGFHITELIHAPMQLISKQVDQVETDKGIEKPAASRAKTKWGNNGRISEGEPGPNLGAVLQDVSTSGKIEWLRWQTIDGKQIAVFSIVADKKKSHFDVSYCCFPKTDYLPNVMGPMTTTAIKSISTWESFRKNAGFHGELFVDPAKGRILRIVTRADLKPTDFVFQELMRIDYGTAVVDGKEYLLPRNSYTVTEETPSGDSVSGACTTRHTLLHAAYQNYQLAR